MPRKLVAQKPNFPQPFQSTNGVYFPVKSVFPSIESTVTGLSTKNGLPMLNGPHYSQ